MKKWQKVLIILAATCFFLCGGVTLLGMQSVDFLPVSGRLDRVVDEYKETGWPWDADQMIPPVSDSENGALAFLEAIEKDKGLFEKQTLASEKWRAGDVKGVKAILDNCEPVLALYVKGSRLDKADFKHDWNKGPSLLFPEMAYGKASCKLLGMRAQLKATDGDLDGALDDLRASFRIGKLLGQIPTVIGSAVESAIEQIALKDALHVASVKKSDVSWLKRVREEVSEWETGVDFEKTLRGEAMMGIAAMRFTDNKWAVLRTDKESEELTKTAHPLVSTPTSVDREGRTTGLSNRAYMVRYLEANIEIKKILDSVGDDPLQAGGLINDYIENSIKNKKEWSFTFSEIIFPAYDGTGYIVVRSRFLPQAVVAALKAAEIKAVHGSYPRKISDFEAGLLDPVTGDAVGYRVDGEKVYVYSVGLNKVDDGGIRDLESGKDDFAAEFPPKAIKGR
jgi:hypothetical protein